MEVKLVGYTTVCHDGISSTFKLKFINYYTLTIYLVNRNYNYN